MKIYWAAGLDQQSSSWEVQTPPEPQQSLEEPSDSGSWENHPKCGKTYIQEY